MAKEPRIWIEISRELAEGLLERLAKSDSDFARRLYNQLDRQVNRYKYIPKSKELTAADSLGSEVLKMKERIMKHREQNEEKSS